MESKGAVLIHPNAYRRNNLILIWTAMFLAHTSFSFALPFAPYFIQVNLGITDMKELAFWLALFGCTPPLTMAIFSPVWGALADRFGRRIMLMRSFLGGTLALSMMGFAASPAFLIIMRLIQGMFCGTSAAAQALLAAHTPKRKSGFVLGLLNSSMYSGSLFGAFIGGFLADLFGYRMAFFLSGGLMFSSFLIVLFGTKEKFHAPDPAARKNKPGFFASVRGDPVQFKLCLPIFMMFAAVMFVRQFDNSYLAVLVQTVHRSMDGVSLVSGTLFAVSGIAGVLSGIVMGWAADHYSPDKAGMFSALFAAFLALPLAFVQSESQLFICRFLLVFISGGMEPVLQVRLCRATTHENQGAAFGWAQTFRSVGWMLAPLSGGMVFASFGIRSIFIAESLIYLLLLGFLCLPLFRKERNKAA